MRTQPGEYDLEQRIRQVRLFHRSMGQGELFADRRAASFLSKRLHDLNIKTGLIKSKCSRKSHPLCISPQILL